MSRSIYTAWLERDPAALQLIGADARDPATRKSAVARAAGNAVAPALLEELRRQQAQLPPDASRTRSLERLAQPGSVAVITGQQVGLFLGPLYTFYKAATAIRAAQALEEETGVPCVPVFWLQTEDHDFAEIDHCEFPGAEPPAVDSAAASPKAEASGVAAVDSSTPSTETEPSGVRRLALCDPPTPHGDRVPVGHRTLGPSVSACVEQLAQLLEGRPDAAEVLAIVRRHYRPGTRVASAFAGMLAELFSGDGLILFDPRQPAVSRLWAPMLAHALRDEQRITFVLEERCAAIRAAGFEPQVHVRPGSPLVFVHPDGAEGPRYRVDRQEDGQYLLVGTDRLLTRDALFTLARRDPFSLSSSALLRPILQDALFPTAAYVGGPGELGYAAQLGPLYGHFGMAPTLFLPRAGFRLIDVKTRRALEGLGITAAEAGQPAEVLLERHQLGGASAHPTADALEAALGEATRGAMEQAATTALALDPELERAVRRTRETLQRAIGRFAGRYRQARLLQSSVTLARLQRVQTALFPGGAPQERRFGWPTFGAAFGVRALHDQVLAAIQPFQPGTRDLLP
ncbi:MAG: bacillithiol biosynthesis BshC [Myxococcota bacterium]|nr:bacillithiol biosynthesis BshC [Myxococcota bacterium]